MVHNKKEDIICDICNCKIEENYITYLPNKINLCSSYCLNKFRKND